MFILGCVLTGRSQESTLQLQDARTREAVAYAHIVLTDLKGANQQMLVSDLSGKVKVVTSAKLLFTVSALGYRLLTDTLMPGQNKKVALEASVYNMDEVVVTGQYTPQAVDKSIFRIKVIGAKHIEQKASNNLGELMAGELNIRTSYDGAFGSTIKMQGLGGEHIKFLVDGVPVVGRLNGEIDLGQLNLHNVKQVEIVEGPMSVIYGSNALAGVINIITGENSYSTLKVNSSAYLESVGIYNFTADATLKKKKWMGSLAAARNFFEGFSLTEDTRTMRWKPKRQYNADASINYTSSDFQLKFSSAFFNEMIKDKGELLKPYFETAFDSDFITNRLTTNLDAKAKVAKDRYINVLASYSYYNRIKNTYFIDLTTLEKILSANAFDQDTSVFGQYLLRAEFSKSTLNSKFNYQLGIDLNEETGYGKRILDKRQQIGDFAAFLSVKLQPVVRFMVQPGLRVAYNTKYKAPIVYSLNTKWDMLEDLSLRASFGKGFRTPSLKELYLEFVDVNHNIRGNENLKAEDSKNVNMALSYHKEKATYDYGAEISMFYNYIHNQIKLAILDYDEALYTYINLDEFVSQGYQLTFNNRLYNWLEIKTGFGQTGRKIMHGKSLNSPMFYSTDLLATINYLWRKTDVKFALNYKYNGDYPEVYANSDGQVFSVITGAYHTMDVNASRSFFDRRLDAQVGVKNLFDVTGVAVRGDAGGGIHGGGGSGESAVAWGRTFFVRLAYRFHK